jgi:hypothetical protein
MVDNVTDLDAVRLSQLIINNWLDAYSDNGALWDRSKAALDLVLRWVPESVRTDAYDLAREKWEGGHINVDD